MERVKSFEQYREIVREGRNLPNSYSNCYFLPAVARDKIERGVLYVMRIQGGILLFEREASFFRCCYFLSLGQPFELLHLPMPAVAEFVFQENMTEAQDAQAHCLQQMGFRLGRESGRMYLDAGRVFAEETGPAETAVEADIDGVFAIIEENFDPLYAYIPGRDDLLAAIREKRVFVIRKNGVPAAVLHAETQKGLASIRHLAVSKNCRTLGCGRRLVSMYHGAFQNEVRGFFHWVDKANTAAIRLYTKFGYSFDGRYAYEYII